MELSSTRHHQLLLAHSKLSYAIASGCQELERDRVTSLRSPAPEADTAGLDVAQL